MMAGLVLAAGQGRRMGGRPKAGVVARGATLLEHATRSLRTAGCSQIAAVLPAGHPSLIDLARRLEVETIANPTPSDGMFSSVRLGVDHLLAGRKSILAIAILPVDHPCVRPDTLFALLAFARELHAGCVRPSFDGHGGHPLVLPVRSARALLAAAPSHTLRDAVRACCTPCCTLPTQDPGVLVNVNTPADLLRIERGEIHFPTAMRSHEQAR